MVGWAVTCGGMNKKEEKQWFAAAKNARQAAVWAKCRTDPVTPVTLEAAAESFKVNPKLAERVIQDWSELVSPDLLRRLVNGSAASQLTVLRSDKLSRRLAAEDVVVLKSSRSWKVRQGISGCRLFPAPGQAAAYLGYSATGTPMKAAQNPKKQRNVPNPCWLASGSEAPFWSVQDLVKLAGSASPKVALDSLAALCAHEVVDRTVLRWWFYEASKVPNRLVKGDTYTFGHEQAAGHSTLGLLSGLSREVFGYNYKSAGKVLGMSGGFWRTGSNPIRNADMIEGLLQCPLLGERPDSGLPSLVSQVPEDPESAARFYNSYVDTDRGVAERFVVDWPKLGEHVRWVRPAVVAELCSDHPDLFTRLAEQLVRYPFPGVLDQLTSAQLSGLSAEVLLLNVTDPALTEGVLPSGDGCVEDRWLEWQLSRNPGGVGDMVTVLLPVLPAGMLERWLPKVAKSLPADGARTVSHRMSELPENVVAAAVSAMDAEQVTSFLGGVAYPRGGLFPSWLLHTLLTHRDFRVRARALRNSSELVGGAFTEGWPFLHSERVKLVANSLSGYLPDGGFCDNRYDLDTLERGSVRSAVRTVCRNSGEEDGSLWVSAVPAVVAEKDNFEHEELKNPYRVCGSWKHAILETVERLPAGEERVFVDQLRTENVSHLSQGLGVPDWGVTVVDAPSELLDSLVDVRSPAVDVGQAVREMPNPGRWLSTEFRFCQDPMVNSSFQRAGISPQVVAEIARVCPDGFREGWEAARTLRSTAFGSAALVRAVDYLSLCQFGRLADVCTPTELFLLRPAQFVAHAASRGTDHGTLLSLCDGETPTADHIRWVSV